MKRCPDCLRRFPDEKTTCPDCGTPLRALSAETIEAEESESARRADIKRARMEALKKGSKGSGAMGNIGIICAILDLILAALFVAGGNISGGLPAIFGLIAAAIGALLLKKPDLMTRSATSHVKKENTEEETDLDLTATKRLSGIATLLVVVGIVLTLVQIGIQVNFVLEQMQNMTDPMA